jgi:hypothetical protein
MAQNTMASTPINRSIAKWIYDNRDVINSTARLLGLPATAIALAAAEEAGHIVDDRVLRDGSNVAWENLKDFGQDFLATQYSDKYLSRDFAEREGAIYWGANPKESAYPSWMPNSFPGGLQMDQAQHPTKMDVGWYNLNIGQALLHLDRYLAETGPGGKFEGDPLHLSYYAGNRRQFTADIASMGGDGVGWKIIGLMLKPLDDAFRNAYGTQYTKLTDEDKSRSAFWLRGISRASTKSSAE